MPNRLKVNRSRLASPGVPRQPKSNVVCVELAPGAPETHIPAAYKLVHSDGWRMFPFQVAIEMPDCLALVYGDDAPSWFNNAYDGETPGWFHGTDCDLSRWVATGAVGDHPNCQRLAAGGSFRTMNISELAARAESKAVE